MHSLATTFATAAATMVLAAAPAHAQLPDAAEFTRQVNAFVDGWHDDAAHTRPSYFDKIAPQGVYIGTDKSEIWTRDQFKAWARPFWERGRRIVTNCDKGEGTENRPE